MILHAYLSYAVADTDAASALKQSAEIFSNDLEFIDHTMITPGSSITEAVVGLIERSDIVFFLVSDEFQASKWCVEELKLADSLGKYIVPLLISSGKLPGRFDHLNPILLDRTEEFPEMLRSHIATLQDQVIAVKATQS